MKLSQTIIIPMIALFFFSITTNSYGLDTATNTSSVDSKTLGFDPDGRQNGISYMTIFTQDRKSGTIGESGADYFPVGNPGAFTNSPFKCVALLADFGAGNSCNQNDANNPLTAPTGIADQVHSFTGQIKSNVSLTLHDAQGQLDIGGVVNFTISPDSNNNVFGNASLSQVVTQDMGNLDTVFDPSTTVPGSSSFVIDNRDLTDPNNPEAISFSACADSEYRACTQNSAFTMNIPWSLDIDQNGFTDTGENFTSTSGGVFTYGVDQGDTNIGQAYEFSQDPNCFAGQGYSESCWPGGGAFDLPGFDELSVNGKFPNYNELPVYINYK